MAQQRTVPPRLTLPPRPSPASHSQPPRFYPTFTPTPTPGKSSFVFAPSPAPTPSKRPRSPEGPLWIFTLLQLLSLYAVHSWLSASDSTPPLAAFAFFALLGSAVFLNVLYRSWGGRPVHSSQWGLLVGSGGILALSYLLRIEGLRSCGPLETILADFAGGLAAKVLLDSSKKSSEKARKARGLVALLIAVFLLSQGWARASCSPLAFDIGYRTRSRIINEPNDCIKVSYIFAPTLAGFLSALQRSLGTRASLRSIGNKKRVHVLSYAVAALILFPFAILQLALMAGQSHWQLSRSVIWPLFSTVAFGMVLSFFGDFYAEEKLLMPAHSFRPFWIVTCCVCMLDLLYGLDISLVGFLFCSSLLGIGVQELTFSPGELSWEALGDGESSSFVYASWVKGPLQHIMSDKKSRKIAIFLLINTGFMVVEFFYGFLSNSLGLISDACHMLFDCAALAIGLYASYISRLPENSKFNYGYGRFEVVSGYANAVLLVLVASLIVLESLERILEPPEISTESLLLVSVGGLLVNLVGLVFFHEEHHHAHGGGGGCSHGHSNHDAHESSHRHLHSDTVKGNSHGCADHSVVNCGGARSYPQPHSHDHHDIPKVDLSIMNHTSGHGLKSPRGLLEDVHTKDGGVVHLTHHKETTSGNHLGKEHSCSKGDLLNFPTKDVQEAIGESTASPESIKEFEKDHSSHSHGLVCTFVKGTACQEHHGHDHDHNHDQDHCQDHNHGHEHDHGHVGDHDHDHDYDHDHNHDHNHCHNHNHGHEHDHGHVGDHNHDHDHSHHHHHHSDHNMHDHEQGHHHHHMDHNMYGIFLHVLADTLGSVGVVISTLLINYKGWLITDPACSIFISALIIASVVPLLRNSGEILLQRAPRFNEKGLKQALKDISSIPGVRNCQRVHMWSFTNTEIVGSLHLQISVGSDKKLIRRSVTRLLRDVGIVDLTLQVEEI